MAEKEGFEVSGNKSTPCFVDDSVFCSAVFMLCCIIWHTWSNLRSTGKGHVKGAKPLNLFLPL